MTGVLMGDIKLSTEATREREPKEDCKLPGTQVLVTPTEPMEWLETSRPTASTLKDTSLQLVMDTSVDGTA